MLSRPRSPRGRSRSPVNKQSAMASTSSESPSNTINTFDSFSNRIDLGPLGPGPGPLEPTPSREVLKKYEIVLENAAAGRDGTLNKKVDIPIEDVRILRRVGEGRVPVFAFLSRSRTVVYKGELPPDNRTRPEDSHSSNQNDSRISPSNGNLLQRARSSDRDGDRYRRERERYYEERLPKGDISHSGRTFKSRERSRCDLEPFRRDADRERERERERDREREREERARSLRDRRDRERQERERLDREKLKDRERNKLRDRNSGKDEGRTHDDHSRERDHDGSSRTKPENRSRSESAIVKAEPGTLENDASRESGPSQSPVSSNMDPRGTQRMRLPGPGFRPQRPPMHPPPFMHPPYFPPMHPFRGPMPMFYPRMGSRPPRYP